MKKVLLIGRLNGAVKEINQFLAQHFYVQLCSENASILEGMMKIVNPDLVLISLIGAYDIDTSIFCMLKEQYTQTPVLTIGTKEQTSKFYKYYESNQFENLIRPIENTMIVDAVSRRLKWNENEMKQEIAEEKEEIVKKKRILVVDDNGTALRTIKIMLEEYYDVAIAISGAQAMTSIGKQRPDLILLDYEMPICDGRMTLEMIRADKDMKDIPVIFLTAVNDRENIEAVLKLKPAGYLLKPPIKKRLIAEIDKVLKNS
ncbi:response regulator [Clostridium sp. MD294]|uniref:response regulator n=1 Tax=Clostridium sp. MD294 TaxID=97138 RepID=UPI0002CAC0F7|nr:response regulator [Clostridium sp. MD294]NDO45374.1 response regulator [Clostridium sp. MD294]USF30985.1 Regulator of RpoS [Clostridium sp. MD294]